jgi:hypothetical protein
MAGLTIHSRSNMWSVIKKDEIRHDEYRNPLNWLIFCDCISQFLLFLVLDGELLVATPTFCLGGNASRCTFPCPRVTIKTLHPKANMHAMVELDGLWWRLLCIPDSITGGTQEEKHHYTHYRQK